MNYIIKSGRNYMAIADSIEADCHKHWVLQMFLSSRKEMNIEVNGQRIPCSAIVVNMDTPHTFNAENKPHFTMLIDPTTELGIAARRLLLDQPFYVFTYEEAIAMQQDFQKLLIQNAHDEITSFARSMISRFPLSNLRRFDDRVRTVLDLLDECMHESESHQLKHFSERTYLSESRLAHLFKAETGIPLKSYIVLHKLQKAYESIFNGENITTAALSAGFDSASHLAYTNKLMTGMSATNILKDSEFLKVL